jgi:hypothetical protein
MRSSLDSVKRSISRFVEEQDSLTLEYLFHNSSYIIKYSQAKLDYFAIFLDIPSSDCEHTGTQTLIRWLIKRTTTRI